MANTDWFDESQFVPTPADRLPATDIDALFEQAFDNPGYRAEFHRRLPDSFLWVLVEPAPDAALAGGMISIVPLLLNDGTLPLFTSEARIREAKQLPDTIRWAHIRARDLLAQAKDTNFVLNPFSIKQLDLPASGIPDILARRVALPELTLEDAEAPESGQALIKTDKVFAPELIDALQALLSQYPRVQSAYLIYLLANGPRERDRYHMRLEVEGEEIQQLLADMQLVVRAFMLSSEGFECWSKLGEGELATYMRQHGQIYERV